MSRRKDEIFGTVDKDGLLNRKAARLVSDALGQHKTKGVIITVERKHKKRSNQQNRYYWGTVVEHQIEAFLDLWGEKYKPSQVHDFNKAYIFGQEKVLPDTGVILQIPGSTSGMSTVEHNDGMEDVRRYMFDNFGHVIPEPNEDLEDEPENPEPWNK